MKKGGKSPSMFSIKVWEIAESIPFGNVTTYGHIARAAGGGPQASRSITNILSNAPDTSRIPFHRVVYASGKVWLSSKYEKERRRLYKEEGIEVDSKGKIKNFVDVLYTFD